MASLKITAEMESSYSATGFNYINFDGLISKAVTYKVPCEFEEGKHYFIPLPLKLLGKRHKYYGCSVGFPHGFVEGIIYWRKRVEIETEKKIRVGSGAFKAYNMPLPVIYTEKLVFLAHGIKTEIKELLELIAAVGKKRSIGRGHVRSWKIQEIDNPPEDCVTFKDRVLRPIPISETESASPKMFCAYYPPYWHHKNETLCYIPQFTEEK